MADENGYPYPAAVTDGEGRLVHYGQWPEPMGLGDFGVFYWERMEIDGADTYAISAIAAFSDANRTEKVSTLSTAHGDGGVVERVRLWILWVGRSRGSPRTSRDILGGNGENQDANTALSDLMEGRYAFHCFNTWGTTEEDQGLYPSEKTASTNSTQQPPSGTWTVSSGGSSLTVRLNPFFADSMSVETGNDWAAGADVPTARPGTKDNPYGVRSIHQLQFINWNHKNQNTSTVLYNTSSNQQDFMYLSYVAQTLWGGSNEVDRTYYWLQTHDLDGSDVEEYTPIAAFRDETPWTMETGAMAYGWFGGSYNGNDYTIQNLNIYTEKINTTGLFGFTLDAELQNIILYAPEGDGLIRSYSPEGDNNWYAVGALVGLAANTAGSDRVISTALWLAMSSWTIMADAPMAAVAWAAWSASAIWPWRTVPLSRTSG